MRATFMYATAVVPERSGSPACSAATSLSPAASPRSAPTSTSSCRDILDGRVEPGRVFDHTIGLDQTAEGYRAMDQGEALKVLIQTLSNSRE